MYGGHESSHDAEVVVQDLGHRRQAIGGAGTDGQYLGLGIVFLVVDPQHYGRYS